MFYLYRHTPASLLCATVVLMTAQAADTPKKEGGASTATPPGADSMEAMMAKWKELATPGAGHKSLEVFVGDWEVDCKAWMAGPDSEPTLSKGKSTVKWILDGRYLQQEFAGDMMGVPFQGMGITGYDNFRKRYFATWMDSMSTGFFYSEGSSPDSGKTFEYQGKMDDAMTGEKDKPIKTVIRVLSKDKHAFEMHDLTLGQKSKIMEMTYTRRK